MDGAEYAAFLIRFFRTKLGALRLDFSRTNGCVATFNAFFAAVSSVFDVSLHHEESLLPTLSCPEGFRQSSDVDPFVGCLDRAAAPFLDLQMQAAGALISMVDAGFFLFSVIPFFLSFLFLFCRHIWKPTPQGGRRGCCAISVVRAPRSPAFGKPPRKKVLFAQGDDSASDQANPTSVTGFSLPLYRDFFS